MEINDMNQELTKETIKKLMEIKGEVKGVTFKTDAEHILKEKGEEGLKRLEAELESLGCPIKYRDIRTMDSYPVGLRAISLLAIKRIFNYDDKKIEEMGFLATKRSLIIKLFVKYFLSIERVFYKEAPKIWTQHFTIGQLIPIELNEEKKYAILRLKDFNLHPVYCIYLGGYFCGILNMLVRTSQITFEETKCTFRGDEYHEYLIKWK
jgi:hypothetical protein